MSEAQVATPEQEAMAQAIQQAQKQAYEDVQKNAQFEVQMRGNSLSLAVEAHKGVEFDNQSAFEIAKTAVVFLEFLKKGEVTNG
jgi:hypothetical protein